MYIDPISTAIFSYVWFMWGLLRLAPIMLVGSHLQLSIHLGRAGRQLHWHRQTVTAECPCPSLGSRRPWEVRRDVWGGAKSLKGCCMWHLQNRKWIRSFNWTILHIYNVHVKYTSVCTQFVCQLRSQILLAHLWFVLEWCQWERHSSHECHWHVLGCVCVSERERESEWVRERERESMSMSMCEKEHTSTSIIYPSTLSLTKRFDFLQLEALEVAHEGMNVPGRHVTILVLQQEHQIISRY